MNKKSISEYIDAEEYDACINDLIERLEQACDNVEVGYRISMSLVAIMANMCDRSGIELVRDVAVMVSQVADAIDNKDDVDHSKMNFVQNNGTLN